MKNEELSKDSAITIIELRMQNNYHCSDITPELTYKFFRLVNDNGKKRFFLRTSAFSA